MLAQTINDKVAQPGTYAASAAGAVVGALHISDVCAIISVLIALMGFLFQVWVQTRRINRLEKKQVAQEFTNAGVLNRTAALEQESNITPTE
jgi:C4-dicarboxylate-specific signal transduction histidine kinase